MAGLRSHRLRWPVIANPRAGMVARILEGGPIAPDPEVVLVGPLGRDGLWVVCYVREPLLQAPVALEWLEELVPPSLFVTTLTARTKRQLRRRLLDTAEQLERELREASLTHWIEDVDGVGAVSIVFGPFDQKVWLDALTFDKAVGGARLRSVYTHATGAPPRSAHSREGSLIETELSIDLLEGTSLWQTLVSGAVLEAGDQLIIEIDVPVVETHDIRAHLKGWKGPYPPAESGLYTQRTLFGGAAPIVDTTFVRIRNDGDDAFCLDKLGFNNDGSHAVKLMGVVWDGEVVFADPVGIDLPSDGAVEDLVGMIDEGLLLVPGAIAEFQISASGAGDKLAVLMFGFKREDHSSMFVDDLDGEEQDAE